MLVVGIYFCADMPSALLPQIQGMQVNIQSILLRSDKEITQKETNSCLRKQSRIYYKNEANGLVTYNLTMHAQPTKYVPNTSQVGSTMEPTSLPYQFLNGPKCSVLLTEIFKKKQLGQI